MATNSDSRNNASRALTWAPKEPSGKGPARPCGILFFRDRSVASAPIQGICYVCRASQIIASLSRILYSTPSKRFETVVYVVMMPKAQLNSTVARSSVSGISINGTINPKSKDDNVRKVNRVWDRGHGHIITRKRLAKQGHVQLMHGR